MLLPITAVRLDHHDVAAFEGAPTDPAIEIIQTSDTTTYERTQHVLRLLIKRFPEHLRHGQDNMTIDHALMEHLADLADPGIDVDFGAA